MPRPTLVAGLAALAGSLAATGPAAAQEAPRPAPAAALPIRDVTVFKDGHAFLLREGELPVGEEGDVVLDDLPRPVLGTFWPYSADERATLAGVVAGRRRVGADRSAASVADVIRANVGAEASFQEVGGLRWTGKILGSPERAPAAGGARAPDARLAPAPLVGDVLFAQTAEGTRAVPLARIESVTVHGAACRTSLRTEEDRGVLTLRLGWRGERAPTARVGMVYLQQGLRWIPEYRIDVDGAGRAQVRLQATLVNDLADLEKANVHLVVGVPRFEFGGEIDPMALAADAAEVGARMPRGARLAQAFSNSIMTQMAGYTESDPAASGARGGALGGAIEAAAASEDLFVFDVKDVTLRRGERMTVPVASFDAEYADVYTVEVAASPPPEVWQAGHSGEDMDRVRALLRPAAMHKLRLANPSRFPITTAPAIVLREGRLLGQGSTVYTPAGGRCDVTVTQAVGLRVRKEDRETERTPEAMRWRGSAFQRVDCEGLLAICNDTDRAVEVEVTRHLLGAVDRAEREGVVTRVNAAEDAGFAAGGLRAEWWPWFNWPWWWRAVNGAGRIEWKVRVEPKSHVDLAYAWHYFWQ